jgi:hypothetical protein
MILRLKHIISLFLVFQLLAPTVIKLEHHHEQFSCNAKHEKHFHTCHKKCLICSFEFSIFSLCKSAVTVLKADYKASYNENLFQSYFSDSSNYSFLLRAPPLFTNTPDFQV